MYRLLATDIDDTVLAIDGSLPEVTRDALHRLHHAGIPIVFSSGRADVSIRSVAHKIVELDDDEYIISFNGARVVTAKTGRPLVENLMTAQMVAEVLSYTRPRNLVVQAYTGDRFLVEKDGPRPRKYAQDTGMVYDVVPDLLSAVETNSGTPKLLIIDEHDVLAFHLPHLQQLGRGTPDDGAVGAGAGGNRPIGGWTATFSKPYYLEVVREGVNKGVALHALAEHLGVDISETIGVGDSLNDAEMVRAAGLGIAVANARDELKEIADVITERSADEGAIAEIVERYFEV